VWVWAQVAHLAQSFKGAAGFAAGMPLGQRSFLGGLLPESLLHMLTSYGAGAFAAALVGDSDTPELVWTHRMRAQRLIPQVPKASFWLPSQPHHVCSVTLLDG
jgi:DnaJ family protein C protein 13